MTKDECCANCKLRKTLWWWAYKLDGMCECFERKENV